MKGLISILPYFVKNLARSNIYRVLGFNTLRYNSTDKFNYAINKFNDVHIKATNVIEFSQKKNFTETLFENVLKSSINKFRIENRSAIWIYIPINLSNLVTLSARYGFKYHHANENEAVLYKWLLTDREMKIPHYATHQMGVAGVVYRSDTRQILVIKDKHMIKDFWKLPGGAADLAENIQDCAVREVWEETGIKTKFESVLAFRQMHNYPNAFGRSDLYVITRLEPITFEINACKDEIKECKWMDLDSLCEYKENKVTYVMANLIKHGVENGFDQVDIKSNTFPSPVNGKFYNLFYREINKKFV